jgi:hypothetical protein
VSFTLAPVVLPSYCIASHEGPLVVTVTGVAILVNEIDARLQSPPLNPGAHVHSPVVWSQLPLGVLH